MALKLGNTDVSKIYLGSTQISKWYLGATQGQGGGGVIPLQIIATRGIIPGNENDGPTNTGAHTRSDIRLAVKSAWVDATDIRMVMSNWKKTGTALEQNGFNDITVDAGLEIGGVNYRSNFDGNVTKTIAAADPDQLCAFPTLATLAAETQFFERSSVGVAAIGQKWARSMRVKSGLDTIVENASTSQAGAIGALVTGGGNARLIGYAPRGLLGRPKSPIPGIWVIGDSLAYGYGTTGDSDGLYGPLAQGFKNSAGKLIPHIIDARSGDVFAYCLPADNPRQWAMCSFATHTVIMLGTNSIPTDTLDQLLTRLKTMAAAARLKNLRGKVYATFIPPRVDSTNSTRLSGYEFGGKPEQYNAAIQAMVGAELDGVIDFNNGKVYLPGGNTLSGGTPIMNPTTGLWADPTYILDEGASTGTHFSDIGVTAAAPTTRLLANTLA